MQQQVATGPSPMSDKEKDAHAFPERYNLENAFVYIDDERHNVKALFKIVVEKLQTSKP